jgi:hypothetical protein
LRSFNNKNLMLKILYMHKFFSHNYPVNEVTISYFGISVEEKDQGKNIRKMIALKKKSNDCIRDKFVYNTIINNKLYNFKILS